MEATSAFSNVEYNSASPFSLLGVAILCSVLHWLVILRDIFSEIHTFLLKGQVENNNNRGAATRAPASSYHSPNHVNAGDDKLFREEVERMMEKLGVFCDSNADDQLCERLGSEDVEGMFDELEVRVEEVEGAFQVFDENSDGFIDAKELGKVLSKLGFEGVLELECEKMIAAYDENGDGRIDLSEFAKLLGDWLLVNGQCSLMCC